MQSVLISEWDAIMDMHKEAHSVLRGAVEPDLCDVHHSRSFLENIESEGQMAEGAITVQATVAFDAFPSSKTSK